MDDRSALIATICERIIHCFAFSAWCEDFAQFVDPEDMQASLDRGADLMSDATRLMSFLELRKLDDFLRPTKANKSDLIASDIGIDAASVLGDAGETLVTPEERDKINKAVTHLTEHLTLDPDGKIDLQMILERSMPILSRLIPKLREADTKREATKWLDKAAKLIKLAQTH